MIAIPPPYVGTKRRRVVEEQMEVLTNMPEPRSLELGAAATAGCSALPELLGAAELHRGRVGSTACPPHVALTLRISDMLLVCASCKCAHNHRFQ